MSTINPLILAILGWTEEQFCYHQYINGLEQIAEAMPQFTTLSDVEDSPLFWEHFRARWRAMDEAFIDDIPQALIASIVMDGKPCPKEVQDMYKNYHGFESFQSLPVVIQNLINQQLYKEQRILAK